MELADLNGASPADFNETVAPLFEGAPQFVTRLARARPFSTFDDLFERAREIAHAMPEEEQLELLDAHPRIGADDAALSPMSRREQAAVGSTAPAGSIAGRLRELNEKYEERFGFRFVVFVAGRPRSEIVPLLEAALEADREAERGRGLDDVVHIARDRLSKLRAREAAGPTIGA